MIEMSFIVAMRSLSSVIAHHTEYVQQAREKVKERNVQRDRRGRSS